MQRYEGKQIRQEKALRQETPPSRKKKPLQSPKTLAIPRTSAKDTPKRKPRTGKSARNPALPAGCRLADLKCLDPETSAAESPITRFNVSLQVSVPPFPDSTLPGSSLAPDTFRNCRYRPRSPESRKPSFRNFLFPGNLEAPGISKSRKCRALRSRNPRKPEIPGAWNGRNAKTERENRRQETGGLQEDRRSLQEDRRSLQEDRRNLQEASKSR